MPCLKQRNEAPPLILDKPKGEYDPQNPNPKEPVQVRWSGQLRDPEKGIIEVRDKLVEASRFTSPIFMGVLNHIAGLNKQELLRAYNAYADLKLVFHYKGTAYRLTGEEYYQHPKAVALIYVLECAGPRASIDEILACLHHDSPEERLTFHGNENHPDNQPYDRVISTLDSLTARYGRKAAKIILACTKPPRPKPKALMSFDDKYEHSRLQYKQLVTRFPSVMVSACEVKSIDMVANNRTNPILQDQIRDNHESDEVRRRRRIRIMHNLGLPIARVAGEKYFELLRTEVREAMQELSRRQRGTLHEDSALISEIKRIQKI